MTQHYLLVEGINIYANVYDTDQLSVIRGSSFLYKKAIDHIKAQFAASLKPISTGASSGLFTIIDTRDPSSLRSDIIQQLNDDAYFQHLTFAVETCEAGNVLKAREKLMRQARFYQLASLSTAPDTFSDKHPRIHQVDELEGYRIAAQDLKRRIQTNDTKQKRTVSLSIEQRWQFGRKIKQEGAYYFAQDIEQLCKHPDDKHPLNHKMAVIYADGNRFGDRERAYIDAAIKDKQSGNSGIEALQTFDETIRKQRTAFKKDCYEWLKTLGAAGIAGDEHDKDAKQALRIETLLWGGDEMLFVVPAWLGLAFLQRFFTKTKTWQLPDAPDTQLTHAAGIVFCQAKTPIRVIQTLAKKLADRVKETKHGRERDGWDYMVLESIDYPTYDNITTFFKQRYGDTLAKTRSNASLITPTETWEKINRDLHALLRTSEDSLPKRKLYHVLEAINQATETASDDHQKTDWDSLFNDNDNTSQHPAQWHEERRFIQVLPETTRQRLQTTLPLLAKQVLDIDENNIKERQWLWLHLLELWDYWLIPEKGELAEGDKS